MIGDSSVTARALETFTAITAGQSGIFLTNAAASLSISSSSSDRPMGAGLKLQTKRSPSLP